MIEIKLTVMGAEVIELDDDSVDLVLVPALLLPGGNQPIPVQLGTVHVPMNKTSARMIMEQFATALDGSSSEPKPAKAKSDLVVAQSLAGVERVAKMDNHIKGKK